MVLLARIGVALVVLLSLAVGVIVVAPYDDSHFNTFMASSENCGGECLLGIHPGTTTVGETMDRLQTHTWVESAHLSAPGTGYGQIRWQWSGKQPGLIDDSHPGRITFYWDDGEVNGLTLNDTPIQTISIYTEMRIFMLQNWFGIPSSGTASFRPDGEMGYSAAYPVRGGTISLSTTLSCPLNLMSYWNAPTKLSISIGRGTSAYVSPLEMLQMC
jgi:hypothetical protein